MTDSWVRALQEYSYPADLADYELAGDFSLGWFERNLSVGDRRETITFEDRFRDNAHSNIEAWYEVIFWKYYSFDAWRDEQTSRSVSRVLESGVQGIITILQEGGADEELVDQVARAFNYDRQRTGEVLEITSERLWEHCRAYVEKPSLETFSTFRDILFKTDVIATAATFPAFLKPDDFPMVDQQVARWATANADKHGYAGCGGPVLVTYPALGRGVLKDRDWDFVQSWIDWCRFSAELLTERTRFHWRARDAEMAVFTAQKKSMTLESLC